MFKLDLEKAEEPQIKLSTSIGSSKKQEFQKNIYCCFIDYVKAFDYTDPNKLWKILKEMGPGDSQGWGNLVGSRLWGRTELDTTEAT